MRLTVPDDFARRDEVALLLVFFTLELLFDFFLFLSITKLLSEAFNLGLTEGRTGLLLLVCLEGLASSQLYDESESDEDEDELDELLSLESTSVADDEDEDERDGDAVFNDDLSSSVNDPSTQYRLGLIDPVAALVLC